MHFRTCWSCILCASSPLLPMTAVLRGGAAVVCGGDAKVEVPPVATSSSKTSSSNSSSHSNVDK